MLPKVASYHYSTEQTPTKQDTIRVYLQVVNYGKSNRGNLSTGGCRCILYLLDLAMISHLETGARMRGMTIHPLHLVLVCDKFMFLL